MASQSTIFHDDRYWEFVEAYHADPLGFAVSVCGMSPSADQEDLFYAITPENAKVSVVSGTSTGKTAAFARIALWHLLCHPVAYYEGKLEIGSNTYIGAPRINQVADGVWKEMTDVSLAIADGPYAWLNDYYKIEVENTHKLNPEMMDRIKTEFVDRMAMARERQRQVLIDRGLIDD